MKDEAIGGMLVTWVLLAILKASAVITVSWAWILFFPIWLPIVIVFGTIALISAIFFILVTAMVIGSFVIGGFILFLAAVAVIIEG